MGSEKNNYAKKALIYDSVSLVIIIMSIFFLFISSCQGEFCGYGFMEFSFLFIVVAGLIHLIALEYRKSLIASIKEGENIKEVKMAKIGSIIGKIIGWFFITVVALPILVLIISLIFS